MIERAKIEGAYRRLHSLLQDGRLPPLLPPLFSLLLSYPLLSSPVLPICSLIRRVALTRSLPPSLASIRPSRPNYLHITSSTPLPPLSSSSSSWSSSSSSPPT